MKRVVINADDFGVTKEISEDIIKCAEANSITSLSFIPIIENIEHSLSLLEKLNIDVGLHFYLTDFMPISNSMRSIVKKPLTTKNLIYLILRRIITSKHIYDEISSQWSLIEKNGISISHISVHRQLNAIPFIQNIVLNFAKEKESFVRLPTLSWCVPKFLRPLVRKLNDIINESHDKRNVKVIPSVSIFEKCTRNFNIEDYSVVIGKANYNTLSLIVHPFHKNNCVSCSVRFCEISHREYEIFTSRSIVEFLDKQGFNPISYRDLENC